MDRAALHPPSPFPRTISLQVHSTNPPHPPPNFHQATGLLHHNFHTFGEKRKFRKLNYAFKGWGGGWQTSAQFSFKLEKVSSIFTIEMAECPSISGVLFSFGLRIGCRLWFFYLIFIFILLSLRWLKIRFKTASMKYLLSVPISCYSQASFLYE
jgi:hypothetical protein